MQVFKLRREQKILIPPYPNQDTSHCDHFLCIQDFSFGILVYSSFTPFGMQYLLSNVRHCRILMMNILLESLFLIMSVQGNTTAYKELIKTLFFCCIFE